MKFFNKKKISIIVENAFEERVLQLAEEAGASGFTVYTGIYGKGRHGLKESQGGMGEFAGNVEIVTITSEEVAEKILNKLQRLIEKDINLIVHVIDVAVLRDEHFK